MHRAIATILCAAVMAACVAPAPSPSPEPTPSAPPATAPPAAAPAPVSTVSYAIPAPTHDNWIDAPLTPGNWFYVSEPAETLAIFGANPDNPQLLLRCDPQTRQIGIARIGSAPAPVAMQVETETMTRNLTASPLEGRQNLLVAEFAAQDSLLDAMAFSRGRIGVHVGGQERLYAPAYPEITRVIEDCR